MVAGNPGLVTSRAIPEGQSMTSERSSVALPGACASGSHGARNHFDLLWTWLAARLRGPGDTKRPAAKLLSVPLSFEPNQGQSDATVQFLSRGSGYALFLTPGKVVLNLERQQRGTGHVRRHPAHEPGRGKSQG